MRGPRRPDTVLSHILSLSPPAYPREGLNSLYRRAANLSRIFGCGGGGRRSRSTGRRNFERLFPFSSKWDLRHEYASKVADSRTLSEALFMASTCASACFNERSPPKIAFTNRFTLAASVGMSYLRSNLITCSSTGRQVNTCFLCKKLRVHSECCASG